METIGQTVLSLIEWIRGAGVPGALVFILAYAAATVALLPGSLLTLGAGFAYGPVLGTAIVSPASVLGATLSFLLGRTVARGWITRKISGNARFSALDRAIGENGLKILVLVRLSPIFPFNVVNYAFGLTALRPLTYILGSFVGMLPGTILFVYLGSLAGEAATLLSGDRPDAGIAGRALYWVGLAATVGVTVLITRIARRALKQAIPVS